jgi:hypothetical protein
VVQFRSIYLDLPIIECRPYRAFGMSQASELIFQLYAGLDLPRGGETVSPAGAPGTRLERLYCFGIRAVFDGRYYF